MQQPLNLPISATKRGKTSDNDDDADKFRREGKKTRHSGASPTGRAKRSPLVTNPEIQRRGMHFRIPGSREERAPE